MEQVTDDQVTDEESKHRHCSSLAHEVEELFGGVTGFARSWVIANEVVGEFNPVSWSVWRLNSFIMARSLHIVRPPHAMLMGYLKFLSIVGRDPVLGTEVELKDCRLAAENLKPDVIAATLFIQSVSCRLYDRPLRRIWFGMLEDAIIRSRIGFELGRYLDEFGVGRAIVAGLAGRIGLITLIATGSHQQAARTLQGLARGGDFIQTGLEIYSADPFHVTAQILLRGGFGLDAAIGSLAYGSSAFIPTNKVQLQWRVASKIIAAARTSTYGHLHSEDWQLFGLLDPEKREDFKNATRDILKKGHGWACLIEPSGRILE
jgi:hypothetical protein